MSATSRPEEQSDVADRIRRVEAGLTAGASASAGADSEGTLRQRMAHHRVTGVSIAVIAGHRIDWARGYGVTEASGAQPIGPDTLFQAASLSKPVTAATALSLVDRGLLSLEAGINDLLTSWKVPLTSPWSPHVTIRQILSHTAGLTVPWFPGYARDAPLPSLTQILDGLPPTNTDPVRVDTRPGLQFRYSGGGYAVLQQLVVDLAERPFADMVRETVLEPAGMLHSSFAQPPPSEQPGAMAAGHDETGAVIAGRYHLHPELAAAGLWSTASDLARFALGICDAYLGRSPSFLSREMARGMLTPAAHDTGPLQRYGSMGLGVFVKGGGKSLRLSHSGSNRGFRSLLIAFPESGCGVAIMTNGENGGRLSQEILASVARAYAWPLLPRSDLRMYQPRSGPRA